MTHMKYQKCPVCDSLDFKLYTTAKDYSISKENFSIDECKNCSLVFTNPVPNKEEIGKYYQSENYISHTDIKKGIINGLYHAVRKYTLNKKVALIKQLNGNKIGKLLDIGCGTGYFLEQARKKKWTIAGFEPDEIARKIANDKLENKIVEKLEKVNSDNFNVITLWHVLEHIHELEYTITKIKSLLVKNGTIIIAVPNIESWDAKYYKEKWAALDVPRHLYHFSKKSMIQFAKKNNLELIETRPMRFDSFYVSMMSEKYKNNDKLGIQSLLKAIMIGLISNIKASQTNNYSSLIYILQKKND